MKPRNQLRGGCAKKTEYYDKVHTRNLGNEQATATKNRRKITMIGDSAGRSGMIRGRGRVIAGVVHEGLFQLP